MLELVGESRRGKDPKLLDRESPQGSQSRPHDYRSATRELDETRLEAENRLLKRRLELVMTSPGWRLISRYRKWLIRGVWTSRTRRRFYDPIARFVLGLLGNSQAEPTGEPAKHSRSPGAINESVLHQALIGEPIIITCEAPQADAGVVVRGQTAIFGWAAAIGKIRRITVSVDGGQPLPVEGGLVRPDVEILLPDYQDPGESGFRAPLNACDYSAGEHALTIEVETAEGKSASLTRHFVVDNRDPYAAWIEERESAGPAVANSERDFEPLISIVLVTNGDFASPGTLDALKRQSYKRWEIDERNADYVVFIEPGCRLSDNALDEIVKTIDADHSIDVLYSDEDVVDSDGARRNPVFKPEFSPDLLRSCNYVGGLLAAKRSLVDEVGGLGEGFERNRFYDLILRLSERATRIVRIPKVLYHRESQRPAADDEAGVEALERHLERSGADAAVERVDPGVYRVRYRIAEPPDVAVIMPAGGNVPKLREALDSVLNRAEYVAARVLVADNSKGSGVASLLASIRDDRVRRLDYRNRPFNFSAICNAAARESDAPLYLFLNDDVEALTTRWLGAMVEHAVRPEVGVVGARLRFPDDTLQHAGVVMGVDGLVGTPFYRMRSGNGNPLDVSAMIRDCSAVTGACLMTRREVFWELGGFDEVRLQLSFQDIDYCLRAREAGYRVVYTPYAELRHHESVSRTRAGLLEHPDEHEYMRRRWADVIDDDPFYSPNLTRQNTNFEIRFGE